MSFRYLCADCGHAQDAEYGAGGEVACVKCGRFSRPFGIEPYRQRAEPALQVEVLESVPPSATEIEDAGDGLTPIDELEADPEATEEVAPIGHDETVDFHGVYREASKSAAGEHPPAQGWRIGRFELRSLLGQGAFGKVYRAFDRRLDREVALKIPRIPPDDAAAAERFLREAKAAARLKHPNIVAVFEGGQTDGSYYIASEFVEGRPLADRIKAERVPTVFAVKIVRDLAMALEYAHGMGVVHRDLKPANVMLGVDGRPQVMDFGLAKRDDDATLTREGSILGTPAYMSPEQARGDTRDVGPASDQYSLGVMLYELLARRRPFEGSPSAVFAKVIGEDPPRLRSIDASIPLDLEAICEKAMAKAPAKRYRSALDFAFDLDRFLRMESTEARPQSPAEQVWRFVRKRPLISALSMAVVAAVAVIIGGGWQLNRRLNVEIAEAKRLGKVATDQKKAADDAAAKSVQLALSEKNAAIKAKKETDRAREESKRAEQQLQRAEAARYAILLYLARQHLRDGRFDEARQRLDEAAWDQRGWEHRYLTGLAETGLAETGLAETGVAEAGLSEKAGGGELGPMIYNAHTMLPAQVAVSPTGDRVLLFDDAKLLLWSVSEKKALWTIEPTERAEVTATAFAPSGETVAVARSPGGVEVLKAETGEKLFACALPESEAGNRGAPWAWASAVQFDPQGKSLFAVYSSVSFIEWSAETGEVLAFRERLAGDYGHATQAAISADCRWAIADHRAELERRNAKGDKVRVDFQGIKGWRLSDGLPLMELPSRQFRSRTHAEIKLALSEHGDYFATTERTEKGTGSVIRVWKWTDVKAPLELWGHTESIRSLSFGSHDRLASVGDDRIVRVWDAASGQELLELPAHAADNWSVAFSGDGASLLSLGLRKWRDEKTEEQPALALWRTSTSAAPLTFRGHHDANTPTLYAVALSPDGRRAVSAGTDGFLRLWSVASGREIAAFRDGHRETAVQATRHLAFSADGATIYAAGNAGISAWNASSGEMLYLRDEHFWEVTAFACDAVRSRFASGGSDKSLFLRDAATGDILKCFGHPDVDLKTLHTGSAPAHAEALTAAAFSKDGEWVASSAGRFWTTGEKMAPQVKLWSVASGKEIAVWESGTLEHGLGTTIRALAFANERLVAAGEDGYLRVLSLPDLKVVTQWKANSEWVLSLAASPDGRHVASGGKDKIVHLWRLDDESEIAALSGHAGDINALVFSADGKTLASASSDGTVKLWPLK